MAWSENHALFFSPASGAKIGQLAGQDVAGHFARNFATGVDMATSAPVFTLASASVPDAPVGKPLILGCDRYTVQAAEPDGTGITRLVLQLVQP